MHKTPAIASAIAACRRLTFVLGLALGACTAFSAEAVADEPSDIREFGAVCDGIHDDRPALAAADKSGAVAIAAGPCVIESSLKISSPTAFLAKGLIRPAKGAIVTFIGPVTAAATRIFDLSAGGRVDLTSAQINGGTPCEWFGCVGGDTSFVPAHATANKTAIDAVLANAPAGPILFRHCGYSTTGHVLDGAHARQIEGCGIQYPYTFYGSGIPWAQASRSAPGDPCASGRFVFQNGPVTPSAGLQLFDNVAVGVNDPATVTPLGLCWYSASYTWNIQARNSSFTGHDGIVIEWANANVWDNDNFTGTNCAVVMYVPVTPESGGIVQKQLFRGGTIGGPNPNTGTLLCQTNKTTGSQAISNIVWDTVGFMFGHDGFILAAGGQEFRSVYLDTLGPGAGVRESCPGCYSIWTYPTGAGGVVIDRLLVGHLGPASEVKFNNEDYISAGTGAGIIFGTGAANGAVYAGVGSVRYRSDATGIAQSPCFKLGGEGGNRGWVNTAGKAC